MGLNTPCRGESDWREHEGNIENRPFPHGAFSPGPHGPRAAKQGSFLSVGALPLFSTQSPIIAGKDTIIEPAFGVQLVG
jgi:hypothetical protein